MVFSSQNLVGSPKNKGLQFNSAWQEKLGREDFFQPLGYVALEWAVAESEKSMEHIVNKMCKHKMLRLGENLLDRDVMK
jgi:hypothetical protein